jgi:hypothetical protein
MKPPGNGVLEPPFELEPLGLSLVVLGVDGEGAAAGCEGWLAEGDEEGCDEGDGAVVVGVVCGCGIGALVVGVESVGVGAVGVVVGVGVGAGAGLALPACEDCW